MRHCVSFLYSFSFVQFSATNPQQSDLLMVNLERNKIDAVVQKRLENATEAVFILRSKEERAASLIQKLVRCAVFLCSEYVQV